MSETPEGAEARRIVDDLEEEIVDVDKASEDQADGKADDQADAVPGSPEPTD